MSSLKKVLPPSMTMSPPERISPSCAIVASVGSPAGSITHTIRGGSSCRVMSSSPLAPAMPASASAATAFGLRSKETTRWPPLARRRAMMTPMRPNPTIPICISCLRHRFVERGAQLAQSVLQILEMDAQHPPLAFVQHGEIAQRLRLLHQAEARLAAGDFQVVRMIAGDLQEDARVGPALVGLTGRVQETGSEADTGRRLEAVAHLRAKGLQDLFTLI